MSSLRFTNPDDIPAYEGWDFKVQPAVITLRTQDVVPIWTHYLEQHDKYHSKIPKDWPRNQEAQRVRAIRKKHSLAIEGKQDLTADPDEARLLWAFVAGLMFGLKFESASCPECQAQYPPGECRVVEWQFGGGLCAEGGHRVTCPVGQTLYSCMEWNS